MSKMRILAGGIGKSITADGYSISASYRMASTSYPLKFFSMLVCGKKILVPAGLVPYGRHYLKPGRSFPANSAIKLAMAIG